jgi:predicted ATP-grasp superfamily ATP-dependent carboligase
VVIGPFLILLVFGLGYRTEPTAQQTIVVTPNSSPVVAQGQGPSWIGMSVASRQPSVHHAESRPVVAGVPAMLGFNRAPFGEPPASSSTSCDLDEAMAAFRHSNRHGQAPTARRPRGTRRRLWRGSPRPAESAHPRVAVLDAAIPPGLAFIRSLGRAGVAVIAYSDHPHAAGRYSRHISDFRTCPSVVAVDELVPWLVDAVVRQEFDVVAPTSDYVAYAIAEAADRTGGALPCLPHPDAARTCLFKDRFVAAMQDAGFPAPPSAAPLTLDEAEAAGEWLGYPLVVKPRSHVGIGPARGWVVRTPEELRRHFRQLFVPLGRRSALQHDAHLAVPLLQRYLEHGRHDVISVTGCLGQDGEVLAVGHSRQARQCPPGTGVGTLFEALPDQPFTEKALAAIQRVIGVGLFELEVVTDRESGEFWALDLNPRGFGQMSLDVARGHDLPRLWYEQVTGHLLPRGSKPTAAATHWSSGVPLAVDTVVRLARGPQRRAEAAWVTSFLRQPRVDAAFDVRDPLPGLLCGLFTLRHPKGLVRPYVRATGGVPALADSHARRAFAGTQSVVDPS